MLLGKVTVCEKCVWGAGGGGGGGGGGKMKQLDSECASSEGAEVLFYHNGAMSSERRLRYI